MGERLKLHIYDSTPHYSLLATNARLAKELAQSFKFKVFEGASKIAPPPPIKAPLKLGSNASSESEYVPTTIDRMQQIEKERAHLHTQL